METAKASVSQFLIGKVVHANGYELISENTPWDVSQFLVGKVLLVELKQGTYSYPTATKGLNSL